jgi:hypothetical protein
MRLFIFQSEASPDLGAFCGDLAGLQLPSQFTPWQAVGVVAPDRDPPYKLSRDVIEAAINARGFQLFSPEQKGLRAALAMAMTLDDIRVLRPSVLGQIVRLPALRPLPLAN